MKKHWRAGAFVPFLAVQQILPIQYMLLECNLWSYPWPSLPLFFTNLNFYKLEQFWSLTMLQSNSCYFCEFCEICKLLEGLLQLCSFEVWTFGKYIILGIDSMFVKSSMIAMKILVTFAIFCDICGLFKALLRPFSF